MTEYDDTPTELTTEEFLLLESVLQNLLTAKVVPSRLDDPGGWDELAAEALGGQYPLRHHLVSTLADLLFVNAPDEFVNELRADDDDKGFEVQL
jgi:hypothetical protein